MNGSHASNEPFESLARRPRWEDPVYASPTACVVGEVILGAEASL